MEAKLHTVVETAAYLADAVKAKLSDEEMAGIVNTIAADPEQGDLVRESGGVRKVRVAGRGWGKSGGYRVMVAYVGPEAPAYILAMLGKGDRANFTKAEIAELKALTAEIKRYWRARRKGR